MVSAKLLDHPVDERDVGLVLNVGGHGFDQSLHDGQTLLVELPSRIDVARCCRQACEPGQRDGRART
jgi:hypothetical protein